MDKSKFSMIEGHDAYLLASKLFPIYRSITGNGVRKSFDIIKTHIGDNSFKVIEIPTGTKVFDWTIPKEWNIEDAYIEDERGQKIISFSDNNLHVVGYSQPIDLWVDYSDLEKYIYTEKKQPKVIPYVTSYYKESSGFCMSYEQFSKLKPCKYHLYIKSSFLMGALSLAEIVFYGESQDEILISTYCCHPSMGNDNCSGMALSAELAKYVKSMVHRKYTYRFIFVPETIGAIAYLAHKDNLNHLKRRVKAGYTLSCVGDDGDYSIIFSNKENSLSDRALLNVMKNSAIVKRKLKKYSFLERGSDERQFNSPNVDLGITGFCRTKYWEFPEYHTSLDSMEFISSEGLQGSFDCMKQVINVLEYNDLYKVPFPCEPQLGKRNLYPNISKKGMYDDVKVMMDLLAYADGTHDLIEISDIIKQPIDKMLIIIKSLLNEGVLCKGGKL